MSETAKVKCKVAPMLRHQLGVDIGFGGDAIVPTAIRFDLPQPYARVGEQRTTIAGDCRDLGVFCDESLDFIYSAHVLEDFEWGEMLEIVRHWRTKLRPGGLWITMAPDEALYREHCRRVGEPPNANHRNPDFGLQTFLERIVEKDRWEVVSYLEAGDFDRYSWLLVCRRLDLEDGGAA